MSYTVHVPEKFERLFELKKYIKKNGLTYKFLHDNSKSFNIFGTNQQIDEFRKFVETYKNDNVFYFNSKSENKNIFKPYFKKAIVDSITKKAVSPYFNAKEISQIYNIGSNRTTRANIAIIELGGGYVNSDLTAYWNYLELNTKPKVYSISVDGAYNSPGSNADVEVVLDIEIVGGICPNSNIYVYFAPNTNKGFYDAIHNAIYSTTHPVSVVSISWGGPEDVWDANTLQAFNGLLEEAANKGITICVASGDNGSSDGESSGNHVDFPASSPWVLACGGTNLVCPDKKYTSLTTVETVWGTIPNDGAAGGGFSTTFNKPSYQNTIINKYNSTMRGVPDICGNADPTTGWIIYINDDFTTVGGTSAVAPMWAAYLANIGFNKFLNPILYEIYKNNKLVVHDITKGNEGAYYAAVGWDPASGLGSPNGIVLTPLLHN